MIPDAWTLAVSTATGAYIVRDSCDFIAATNRSMVAEMPHTTGTAGFEPDCPAMIRCTMVGRCATCFMPRCASSSTR